MKDIVLITGANGNLAKAVEKLLSDKYEIRKLTTKNMKEKLKRQLKEFFKEVTEREASTTKEAVKDVKEVVEGLGIRKEIICENDSNAEEKDVATNKEVLAEEATKDVGTVEKESILEDETKEIRAVDSQEGGILLEAASGEEIAKGEEKIAAIKESSKEVIE